MLRAFDVVMDDQGLLVVPPEVRRELGWHEGRRLHLLESDRGVVVMTREQLKDFVRRDLEGLSLLDELLTDRRAASSD
jgi:bifunctional DNA-binding transcriptional regulator/antitoxin component of YhaV-PrlF toxin-antitoxin module